MNQRRRERREERGRRGGGLRDDHIARRKKLLRILFGPIGRISINRIRYEKIRRRGCRGGGGKGGVKGDARVVLKKIIRNMQNRFVITCHNIIHRLWRRERERQ
jgi:hypothetical protein